MTVETKTFLSQVLPEVPGCPQVVALQHIVNAAIDLCNQAPVWKERIPTQVSVASTADYVMTSSAGRAVMPLQVFFNNLPLEPKTDEELKAVYPASIWLDETGDPLYFTIFNEGTVKLVPNPTTAGLNIDMLVSLKPLPTATTVPDQLYYEYFKTIAAGAKASLMVMPEQRWTNPTMSAYYSNEFKTGIAAAMAKAATGKVKARIRVSSHS